MPFIGKCGYKHKHTLTVCNIYCFPTTTMVAWTRQIVTLSVHRLSCGTGLQTLFERHPVILHCRPVPFTLTYCSNIGATAVAIGSHFHLLRSNESQRSVTCALGATYSVVTVECRHLVKRLGINSRPHLQLLSLWQLMYRKDVCEALLAYYIDTVHCLTCVWCALRVWSFWRNINFVSLYLLLVK